MRRLLLVPLLLATTFCAGSRGPGSQTVAQPGHGAASMEVTPNPIVATRVSGETFDFPFEVVVRETGGHPLTVTRVSADVFAFGGIQVASESYDAARITSLGYPTTIAPNATVRYRFNQRKSVPDERLFTNVSAEVRLDAVDDTGTPTTARTTVTVTKR